MTKRTLFSAIPLRAMNDTRLAASHFRVLLAVCWHARLNRGAGCYAGRKTLCRETALADAQVSRCMSDLISYGYIAAVPKVDDRRRMVYIVIYGDDVPGKIGDDSARIGDEFVTKHAEIGDAPNRQPVEAKEEPRRNIFSETVSNKYLKRFSEAGRHEGKDESDTASAYVTACDVISHSLKIDRTEAGTLLLNMTDNGRDQLYGLVQSNRLTADKCIEIIDIDRLLQSGK